MSRTCALSVWESGVWAGEQGLPRSEGTHGCRVLPLLTWYLARLWHSNSSLIVCPGGMLGSDSVVLRLVVAPQGVRYPTAGLRTESACGGSRPAPRRLRIRLESDRRYRRGSDDWRVFNFQTRAPGCRFGGKENEPT